jgi:succinate-semialdehyde dehydrogenase/glutarate-semialdehyde dehydrogenase
MARKLVGIESVNPTTGDVLATFTPLTDAGVETALDLAAWAFDDWSHQPIAVRAALLLRAADLLEHDRERLARLMTLEMGKPLRAAVEEVEKCAAGCRFYARNADRLLADETMAIEGEEARVAFHPMGAVLAIMPWNFPFWQVFRFAAPALLAGNVALLKHASNVPQCALAIEDILRRAGAPDGVFQTLLIGSDQVEQLVSDSRVAAVTLTGSDAAGAAVAAAAGRALKKTVLELGGSDPFIVLPDADIAAAAATAARARVVNSGQSCIAAKRFIAVGSAYEPFTDLFVRELAGLVVGDPMDPATQIGPLATKHIRDDLTRQLEDSIEAGATVLLRGGPRDGPGWYFEPAALADLPWDSPAARDETFGPLAAVFRADDLPDAVRIANNSRFGLGASVWTASRDAAESAVRSLDVGTVVVNGMVRSDPRLPFGGVKTSGYGRELGIYGLREFVNVKTVRITGL